jgi:hypothetical protein
MGIRVDPSLFGIVHLSTFWRIPHSKERKSI